MLSEELSSWIRNGTAGEFDALARQRGLTEMIPDLMALCPDLSSQAQIVRRLAETECLKRQPRQIRTIAVFYYRIFNGGVERVMAHLIWLWVQAGYRVIALTDLPANGKDEPLPDTVKRYTLPDTFAQDMESRQARFRQIQRILREEKADVLVHHAWLSINLLWDILAAKALGIALIEYTHGVFSCLLTEGRIAEMDILPCLTQFYRLPDLVVTLSNTNARFWRYYTPCVTVMLNPCIPAKPRPEGIRREPALVLWVGRISAEKQPLDCIRIFAALHARLPEARLMMVGEPDAGNDTLMEEIRSLIDTLGVRDAVSLEGFHQDVSPYYMRASLLLSTSMFEGFSLVIAEAKTYGVPCVMYDLPYTHFAEEGKGLFSVPQGEVTGAADLALRLLTEKDAWERASAEALESAESFSDESLTRCWQEIFSGMALPPEPAAETDDPVMETLLRHLHIGFARLQNNITEREKQLSIRRRLRSALSRLLHGQKV